jgi:REase_AHJR-like
MSLMLSTYEETLKSVATEYESEGFSIILHPNIKNIPSFLPSITTADIIATRSGRNIITVLHTHESFSKDKGLSEWAKIIEKEKDWRLDLVVYNAAVSPIYSDPVPAYWSLNEIQDKLSHLKAQHSRVRSEEEIIECLQIVEASLCFIDEKLRAGSTSWRLRQAFTEGWLSQNQLQILQRALQERRGQSKLNISLLGWRELLPVLDELEMTLKEFQALASHQQVA